jgi:hypothetical protein
MIRPARPSFAEVPATSHEDGVEIAGAKCWGGTRRVDFQDLASQWFLDFGMARYGFRDTCR